MTEERPDWIVPRWPAPPSVQALATTRAGGVSSGAWAGLNLGLATADERERVLRNRALLRAHLPAAPRWLRQVHGARVVDAAAVPADGADPGATVEADAAFTAEPGVVAAVLTADCLPVLFADAAGRCVAAAHAGWRGLAAGVLQATAHAVRARVNDPGARLVAWLGPAIGPDHFEVGADVLDAMSTALPDARAAFVPRGPHKFHADLYALARMALAQAGVDDVHGGGDCTYCDAARFYSHRRDRATGRQATLIWISASPDDRPRV